MPGCPIQPDIITQFKYNSKKGVADATLRSMFKFQDSSEVHFQCDIAICKASRESPPPVSIRSAVRRTVCCACSVHHSTRKRGKKMTTGPLSLPYSPSPTIPPLQPFAYHHGHVKYTSTPIVDLYDKGCSSLKTLKLGRTMCMAHHVHGT
uniref:ZP domain-containing protein n=1 Tax=Timema cristinae TaxID=61476 RepID=A0A7R9H7H1_TIMCR|nr:unnamed protein product [Timema cristinae]